jgi:erythromycin esterase-like protein
MFRGSVESWNLRDAHMADTVDALLEHLGGLTDAPKVVVWAHNSHVGDARGTELGEAGEHTLGQLVRLRHPGDACLIGFSTYEGTVTAASDWGAPAERMHVRPGLPGSVEDLFHRASLAMGGSRFLLDLRGLEGAAAELREPRLARAIGVVYKPRTERQSHYFHVRLAAQLDAIVHIDHTRAVEPLDRRAGWELGEAPETFPTGM